MRNPLRSKFLVPIACSPLLLAFAASDDRTLDEFKEYVAGKMPDLTEAQLDAIAKGVDADGNGTITDVEFGKRMEVIRSVMSGGAPAPTPPKERPAKAPAAEQPTGEVVVLPPMIDYAHVSLLLITADELATAWLPFAKWKTSLGKGTRILTVGQIDRDYEGPTIQEKIRAAVREHVDERRTKWVLLGGDCTPGGGLVPGGHVTVHQAERKGIPTDIVYLSPTNWDADGDGIYGEWEDDREAITYPDGKVGLGRVPVRTAADVKAFTDKVIAYESNYPTNDFATGMVYTCTDSPAYPKVRRSWDDHLGKVWKEGRMARFFSDETPWDEEGKPGSHALSTENLIALINAGNTGKMHIHGHGHLPQWILERSKFGIGDVSKLKNEGAYPLITTVSCNTGEYDSKQDPSIVEAMIRAPKAGSVAIVAPVRTGKPHFHDRSDFALMVSEGKMDGTTTTMARYWTFGHDLGITTGEAFARAKHAMIEDARKTPGYHLCICELNLLGDPTLTFRTKAPRTPQVTVPDSVGVGNAMLEVVTDAPGASVTVLTEFGYVFGGADTDGKATFEIWTKNPGEIKVTVNRGDLNAAIATVAVK